MPACHAGDRRFESGRVRHHHAFPYAPSARPDGAFLCPAACQTIRWPREAPSPSSSSSASLALAARRPAAGLGRRLGLRRARHRRRPAAGGGRDAARDRRPTATRTTLDVEPAASPRATPSRAPTPRRRRADARSRDVPIVPVTQFRTTADVRDRGRGRGRAGRDEHALRRPRARRGARPTRSSPRSASIGRPTRRALVEADGRGDARARTSPSTASGSPSCAPTRSRRRSARWPGARPRCSASSRVTDLADWPLTARLPAAADGDGLRPGRRRGPCSRAATSCSTAASPRRSRSRARASTSRSMGAPPRSPALQGLLGVRAGTCRTPGGPANAGAMRDLIEGADIAIANFENPAPEHVPLPHVGDGLLGRPEADQGARERRHRLGGPRQQPHPRRRAAPGILQTIKNLTKHGIAASGAGKDLKAAPQAGDPRGGRDEGRDPRLRHDRPDYHAAPTGRAARR